MANDPHRFGAWQPYHPHQIAQLFSSLPVPWWIAGGWAIDLFLGVETRTHADIDIQFLRTDQQAIRTHLQRWDLQAIHPTKHPDEWPFHLWEPNTRLGEEVHNLWCRPGTTDLWKIELMIGESSNNQWIFRRDSRITRPLATIGLRTPDGIPFLAPEIQLLYKAKSPRSKDQADFSHALPHLSYASHQWLTQALALIHPYHPWLHQLEKLSHKRKRNTKENSS